MNARDRLQELLDALGADLKPGTLIIADVLHDDGCPALATESLLDCTCEPDFRVCPAGHEDGAR